MNKRWLLALGALLFLAGTAAADEGMWLFNAPPTAQIKAKYGKLHLVVNNAGIKTLRQASQAKFEEWDNAVAVNVTAIYNSVATCLPHMLEHGEGGHFVTTASLICPASCAQAISPTFTEISLPIKPFSCAAWASLLVMSWNVSGPVSRLQSPLGGGSRCGSLTS